MELQASNTADFHIEPKLKDERRNRTLTEKGRELYDSRCEDFEKRLDKSWFEIENILVKVSECEIDLVSLKRVEQELLSSCEHFNAISDEYLAYLKGTNTHDSQAALEHHMNSCKKNKNIVKNVLEQIKQSKLEAAANTSVGSRAGRKTPSERSSNSALSRKRIKAEMQKTRLIYMEKEAQLLREKAVAEEHEANLKAASVRQKAEIAANLSLLKQQTETAVAEVEVKVLENEGSESGSRDLSPVRLIIGEEVDHMALTENYVNQLPTQNLKFEYNSNVKENTKQAPCNSGLERSETSAGIPLPRQKLNFEPTPQSYVYNPAKCLNPCASIFNPSAACNNNPPDHRNTSDVSDITRFLLKKELLLSRFTPFNDRPETFATWKSSFQSIVRELHVTPFEELDLLSKWLGPVSSKFASSLRAANINNPARGLQRIWDRLEERYGRPEMVESALKSKLNNFPKITGKDPGKLYDLLDILSEIESCKENEKYSTLLSYYDASSGILPIVNKLPYGIQEKWTTRAASYKLREKVSFPPFSFFVDFIREISTIKNDPAFMYEYCQNERKKEKFPHTSNVLNRKTLVEQSTRMETSAQGQQLHTCPLHKTDKHSLATCRAFKAKSHEERKKLLKNNKLCFRCCISNTHVSRNCRAQVKCNECNSISHCSVMHIVPNSESVPSNVGSSSHGGEHSSKEPESVSSKCTTLCGSEFTGSSCGKIVLVNVYPIGQPKKSIRVYAILDDQSNKSLGSSELFDRLGITTDPITYTLISCAGNTLKSGRRANGLVVESLDHENRMDLPILIECDDIPDERSEIPTPEIASSYVHLRKIAGDIPPLDSSVTIQLLIGRDLAEAHHVNEQIVGPKGLPFAQRLKLGWVIVGEICLNKVHRPDVVYVNKTNVLSNGRGTIFKPCNKNLKVEEHFSNCYTCDMIFQKASDDDKIGLSVEDRKFLDIMDKEFKKNNEGYWTAPLPFKSTTATFPNNKSLAWRRAQLLDTSLKKDPVKYDHFVTFMKKVFDSGVAEVASADVDGNCWYLPLFGVYHPRKLDQIRGVFDSSAEFQGVSLNNMLMAGPDLTNNLLEILLRFRMDAVAVTADVEQMFYKFYVDEAHRDYLRFFWYRDNDPNNEIIEYRMKVHVFGNRPSPAVATYGLRKVASISKVEFGTDVSDFITNNFYVDDGLLSLPNADKAVDIIRRTQGALMKEGNIRLHKIASNSMEVMAAFPVEDLSKDLKNLCLGAESLPVQHSLGQSWDLNSDHFVFDIQFSDKPYTRRGLLSLINSVFDPLGVLAPITISGKILLRELSPSGTNWDEPLSLAHRGDWTDWCDSLQSLNNLGIPRTYVPISLSEAYDTELHIFSDASEKAIAAAAYLRAFDSDGNSHVGFVMGKTKLAPASGHTIPRLELCGAVLASEISQVVLESLNISPSVVRFYTDSKVVLGYIGNETRRFYTYVSNRVDKILKVSKASQWNFVPTHLNPADCGTRFSTSPIDLKQSMWLTGPKWLHENAKYTQKQDCHPLVNPDQDKEVRPCTTVVKTTITPYKSIANRIAYFSNWRKLVRSISLLQHLAISFQKPSGSCNGWHTCHDYKSVESFEKTQLFIIREVQREEFRQEIRCLSSGNSISKSSSILALSPFLDKQGLLRVGGRLNKVKGSLTVGEVNPIIIPKGHLSKLLIDHYHNVSKHQGRHITEGALRNNGLWLIGARRAISSFIRKCVICRRLRGELAHQKMADLPLDRISPGPPFTSVGVDTFGPWEVVTRKTRRGAAHSKRWAILFTCLTTRGVHIEVIEELSSSCFINALRRFQSLRGHVKLFRSDRGTNFIGATDDLRIDSINVEDDTVQQYMYNSGTTWKFNAPHSSHMGGVWERMIGITRRILNSIILTSRSKHLTHEVLVTFMAEVCAVINSRPITEITSDPDSPMIITPNMLLTGKVECLPVLSDSFDTKDIYRAQWRHVQVISNLFWKQWRESYLQHLQARRKWCKEQPNLEQGNVVLLRDKAVSRIEWPIAVIDKAIKSDDGKVRKAQVRVFKDRKNVLYTRPISEMVLLID